MPARRSVRWSLTADEDRSGALEPGAGISGLLSRLHHLEQDADDGRFVPGCPVHAVERIGLGSELAIFAGCWRVRLVGAFGESQASAKRS